MTLFKVFINTQCTQCCNILIPTPADTTKMDPLNWIEWNRMELNCCSLNGTKWQLVQLRSVAQSCPTLCDPMDHNTPGLPVYHQLPESTQTHVHQVGDSIQPSHPLSSPSPAAPNPSQHQSLFQWVNSAWGGQSTGVSALASFLPKNTQGWSPYRVL